MADHGGKTVFTVSALIILALVAVGAAFPEGFGSAASAALAGVTQLFGWFYLFWFFADWRESEAILGRGGIEKRR